MCPPHPTASQQLESKERSAQKATATVATAGKERRSRCWVREEGEALRGLLAFYNGDCADRSGVRGENSYKWLMPFVKGAEVTAQRINKDVLCSRAGHVESAASRPLPLCPQSRPFVGEQSRAVAQGEGAGRRGKRRVRGRLGERERQRPIAALRHTMRLSSEGQSLSQEKKLQELKQQNR